MKNQYTLWLFLVLVLSLFVLATVHLNDFMWTDEYRTMFYAGATPDFSTSPSSFAETINRVAENRWQAPLFYVLLWAWGHVAGWTVFAMRIPALLFGCLTLAITYRLTKRLYSQQVAIYSTLILGLNGFFLHFLHEMRTYSLFMLLTGLMLWLYTNINEQREKRLGLLILFTMTLLAMLYTHYFAAFPIAGLGLWHLLVHRKQPQYWAIVVSFALAGIAFLPWFQVLWGGIGLTNGRSYKNLSGAEVINGMLYIFSNGSLGLLLLLIVPIFFIKANYRTFILPWSILSLGLMLSVTRVVPALLEIRYAVFLWPAISIFTGLGIARLVPYRASWPVIALWAFLFIGSLFSAPYQQRIHPWSSPPFPELADELKALSQPDDAVLYVLPPLEESINDTMLDFYFSDDDVLRASIIYDQYATSDSAFRQQIVDSSKDAKRLWLSYETDARNWRMGMLEDTILSDLGYLNCGLVSNTEDLHTALFARQPDIQSPLSFSAFNNFEIDFYNLSPAQIINHKLVVNVGWYVPTGINANEYSIGIHLDNGEDQLVLQSDIGITRSGFGCSIQFIDVSDLPAGEYTFKTTVYNWKQGNRLPNVQQLNEADGRVVVDRMMFSR